MAATRQSNMELCRIVSIVCVMLIHSTFQSLGHDVSFWVMLLAGFSIIGVNVFVMLAGYFTAAPKKSSLINLIFVCFFWMIVKIACSYVLDHKIGFKNFFFVTSSNWFIPSYIGLLFFAPILNLFCNSVSKKMLVGVVTALLVVEIWFDWIPPYPSVSLGTNGGHSVLSFLILYLMSRTIRLYGLPMWFKRLSPFIYIGCSLLLAFMGWVVLLNGYENKVGWVYFDNNPIVILSSLAFLVTFEQMNIGQSKFINHIAKSTLAVLLGHSAIFFIYTKQFKYLYDNFSGIQVMGFWVLAIIVVFCASIAIDQLRLLMWKPIEMQLRKRIKKNELF